MAIQRDPRATFLVVGGLVVAAIGLATIGVHAHLSPDGRAANDGFLVALCLAGAAVGFTRYRSTGDTHPLFVAAGLLVVATQTLVFDQNWILSDSTMPWEAITLPALGWFFGWLVAAVGFVLARPWWDRRGRKPIHAPLVLGVAAATLFVIDLFLVVLRHSLPHAKNVDLPARPCVRADDARCSGSSGARRSSSSSIAAWREWRSARRRPLAAPVARHRLGDRRSGAGRDAGAAHLVPPVDRAGGRAVLRHGRTCPRRIPCTATRRGLPGPPRHRPRAGGDGRSGRDRSDDLPRGPRSRQHDPRTRRDGALALRPADRRRATRAPGPDRAGIPPTPRNRDTGVHRAQGRRGHRQLRHPDARLRQHRP